ncbi:MAG: alpha-hydroxy-acid oxidizing protein [Gammaproteobacteria bacterium]|nr:alpha-hydroxy-acid oxidizing protein [Gammaproteobacteria bacterium]
MNQAPHLPAKLVHIPPDVIALHDYARRAADHLPAPILAWLDGGSGEERTVAANRAAFARWPLVTRLMRDLARGGAATRVLGCALTHPIMLAPVAHHGLVHADGECATAAGAAAATTLYVVSALATRPLEDIAAAGHGPKWFQLYWQTDREATLGLAERASRAGYRALVFTADTPVASVPERAQRAGFALPRELRPANVVAPAPRELTPGRSVVFQGYMGDAPRWEDFAWLARRSPLPLLLKGVLHPDDAARARDAGAAGVVVSNHGGRALDGVPASLDCLPAVRAALGDDATVLLDGGIRRGSDVLVALALGADAVLIGRPQLHGLAVAGALGVAHVMRLLQTEFELAMALAGCARVADIDGAALHAAAVPARNRAPC